MQCTGLHVTNSQSQSSSAASSQSSYSASQYYPSQYYTMTRSGEKPKDVKQTGRFMHNLFFHIFVFAFLQCKKSIHNSFIIQMKWKRKKKKEMQRKVQKKRSKSAILQRQWQNLFNSSLRMELYEFVKSNILVTIYFEH